MRWIFIALFLVSCFGKTGPEDRLRGYLNLRLKGGHEKEDIMDYLTGSLKEDIAGMEDEEFNQFSSLNINKAREISILKKNCKEDVCFLTYTFKYSKGVFDGDQEKAQDVSVEIKKTAKLEMSDEKWRISAIDNIKSFVRFNRPIDIYN